MLERLDPSQYDPQHPDYKLTPTLVELNLLIDSLVDNVMFAVNTNSYAAVHVNLGRF
jgi:hypothetical protein